jgi:hypothetical protein
MCAVMYWVKVSGIVLVKILSILEKLKPGNAIYQQLDLQFSLVFSFVPLMILGLELHILLHIVLFRYHNHKRNYQHGLYRLSFAMIT